MIREKITEEVEKPTGDYRNALNELEKTGVVIPKVMKIGFDKLYGYTNNKETGIRHALMDNEGTYIPSSSEAIFMIVSCSAFINYLYAKKSQ